MIVTSKFTFSIVGVLALALTSLSAAIMTPEQRVERIEKARALAGVEVTLFDEDLAKKIGTPFSRNRLPKKIVKKVVRVLNDDIILEEVSKGLVPDGVFQVNGEYIALFGGTRIKQGDTMIRRYMDQEYEVIFDELDSSAIAIRYGKAQLRIKLK